MVRFETSTYYKQGNTIVGAEVIVSAETGEEIGSITVLSSTDYDEFLERFENLSSEFVSIGDPALAGQSIATILQNINEGLDINATKLGGLASDKFAKTSHTHSKNNITDLYDYDISLSKYNVSLNETITVKVKVTNQAGNAVSNASVPVLLNGANWKTGRTNSSGIYETNYTATNSGVVTFSAKNQKIQCHVEQDTGWINLGLNGNFNGFIHLRVKNNVVYIRGHVYPKRNISSANNTLATITDYIPTIDNVSLVQGGLNTHSLNFIVHNDGRMTLENLSESKRLNLTQGIWLPIATSYLLG